MRTFARRVRLFVVMGLLLSPVVGLMIAVFSYRSLTRRFAPTATRTDKPELDELLGHVVRVDGEQGEIVGDFGRSKGIEPGMKVGVYPPTTANPKDGEEYRGEFEITVVGENETTAQRIGGPTVQLPGDPRESRPGDEIFNATDPEDRRLLSLATGDDPEAIVKLTQTRLEAARKWLDIAGPFTENGSLTQDRLIQASRGVMDAERDAAKSHDEEVAAIVAHLKRMTDIIERLTKNTKFEGEGRGGPNYREARAEQAATALMLARVRRGKQAGR